MEIHELNIVRLERVTEVDTQSEECVVPFDRIEMHIDYPLVDDVDGDEAPTSA